MSATLLFCRSAPDRPPPAPPPVPAPSAVPPDVSAPLSPPGHFIANRGQLDSEVIYYLRGRRGSIFLTAGGVVFDFIREREREAAAEEKEARPSRRPGEEAEKVYDRLSFRINFEGGSPAAEIAGEEELPGRVSYFRGSDPDKWRSGIPTFAAVSYREVWPGVDLVFRLEGGNLRWRASVSPGADPASMTFRYEGVDGLALGAGGELLVDTAFGVFVEPPPSIRQEKDGEEVVIEGGWKIREGSVAAVEIGGFDPVLELIIER